MGIKSFDNGISVVTRFGIQQAPANEFSNLAFPYLDRQTAKAGTATLAVATHAVSGNLFQPWSSRDHQILLLQLGYEG
jgi:hypothetical protein